MKSLARKLLEKFDNQKQKVTLYSILTGETTPRGDAVSKWSLSNSDGEVLQKAQFLLPDGFSVGKGQFDEIQVYDSDGYQTAIKTVKDQPYIYSDDNLLKLKRV